MRLRIFMMLFAAAVILTVGDRADAWAEEPAPGTVEIREWEVPYPGSRPRDPFVVGNDEVWFVGQKADYVARFTPSTGEFMRFDLPAGTGPHNVVVAADGMPYYAGNRDAHIGRLDPETGKIDRIEIKNKGYSDPHTLVIDNQGDIWFTLQNGNAVGRLETETSEVTIIDVPTASARPYGIKIDRHGTVWVVEFGSFKLARIDRTSMALIEISLPRKDARPRRLGITLDDNIWYVDYREGYLGRYDPAKDSFKEWQLPGGAGAKPYGMAVDVKDVIWIVETGRQPNRFIGFDARRESFTSVTEIPGGGGSIRHMDYHAPSGTVWFGTDRNTIGYARVHGAGGSSVKSGRPD